MKHFQKIATGLDVLPLMHAVQRQPELFNENRYRTTFENTPHGQINDILLRFSAPAVAEIGRDTAAVMNDDRCVWYPAADRLPQFKPLVLGLMARVGGYELGRVLITKLPPGGRILPHADNVGSYVSERDRARYHVVLNALPGSLYRTGEEVVEMLTGEVWWFDALTEHEVVNNSTDDRVHLLVDMRTL